MKMTSLFQSCHSRRSAFILFLALALLPAIPVAHAQELLPELAEPAAKHKAADEALDKQRQEAVALAAKSYVSALDEVEKSATTAGQLTLIAAVVKEREAVASGSLDPELPAALPKKLQSTRKPFLSAIERITADFTRRKQQVTADHIRYLAALQPKAASNPELAKQITAEKAALLAGGGAGGGAGSGNGSQTAKQSRGKNVVVNGGFEKVADGKPDGWTDGWKSLRGLTVETEGGNTFVRYEGVSINNDDTTEYLTFFQEFDIPKGVKNAFVSAKLRTKGCVISKKSGLGYIPGFSLAFHNQDNQPFAFISAEWDKKNGTWKVIQKAGPVPNGAVKGRMELTNGSRSGQIDFDDVEVTFK